MSSPKSKKSVKKKRKYSRRKYLTRYDEDFFKKGQYKPRQRAEKKRSLNENDEVTVLPSFNEVQLKGNDSPYLDIASPILDALYYEIVSESQ